MGTYGGIYKTMNLVQLLLIVVALACFAVAAFGFRSSQFLGGGALALTLYLASGSLPAA